MSTPAYDTHHPRQPLGPTLRQIRARGGLTIADVTAALGWSTSKLSRIETSGRRISSADLTKLLDHLAVPAAERATLAELAAQIPRRSAAVEGTKAIPGAYGMYATLEAQAETILTYAPTVIPGLLQIPEYASAIIHATPDPEDHLANERISTRLMRQAAVFARPAPPTVHFLLEETAVRRPVGGHSTMRRQLLRILEVSEAPKVTVQLISDRLGAHPALSGAFNILEFADQKIGSQVFLDALTGGFLISTRSAVARYRRCFEVLVGLAFGPSESSAILTAAAEETRAE